MIKETGVTYGPITAVNEDGRIDSDVICSAGVSSLPFQQNVASEISTTSEATCFNF